jgi:hypothetical protein
VRILLCSRRNETVVGNSASCVFSVITRLQRVRTTRDFRAVCGVGASGCSNAVGYGALRTDAGVPAIEYSAAIHVGKSAQRRRIFRPGSPVRRNNHRSLRRVLDTTGRYNIHPAGIGVFGSKRNGADTVIASGQSPTGHSPSAYSSVGADPVPYYCSDMGWGIGHQFLCSSAVAAAPLNAILGGTD